MFQFNCDACPASVGDADPYKERELPESISYEDNSRFFPFCASDTASPSKTRLLTGSFSPGDMDSLSPYAEVGFPDSIAACDQFLMPQSKRNVSKGRGDESLPQGAEAKAKPPDISDGVGRSQSKKDLAHLESYIKAQREWSVHGESIYRYDGKRWRKLSKSDTIRAIKEIFLRHTDLREALSERDYQELYNRLLTDPLLYQEERFISPVDKLNCEDGILDLSRWPPRKAPHDPEDGFLSVLPLTCGDILDPPMDGYYFESFAASISGGDPNVRQQLLELTAVALTGRQVKHFYVMLGPSNSGKSQFGRFLLELLGAENVMSVRDMNDFGDRWTVGSLADKRLGLCMDLPDAPLSKAAIGILKQFCGADAVKAEQKYANSFTYYEKPLLLLGGNHAIRIPNADHEEAFLNRMIIIPFSSAVSSENRIPDFYLKLLEEAPYIVHEAISAYQNLASRNYELTRAEVPQMYQAQEGCSLYGSICDFVKQNLTIEQGAEITTAAIYEAFCVEGTHANTSRTAFSKTLSRALGQLIPAALPVKRVNGAEMRGYKNIAFTPVF